VGCPTSYSSNSLGNQAHLRQTTAEGRNVQRRSIRDLAATVETHSPPARVYAAAAETDYRQLAFVDSNV